jgi:hypothetical protein
LSHVQASTWQRLAAPQPRGEAITARIAIPELTHRLLAGLDSAGRHHWLIPVNQSDSGLEDRRTRGLTVSSREMVVNDSGQMYIDIECCDASGNGAFDLIGGELALALSDTAAAAASVVERTVGRWRRFWGEVPQRILPTEILLGLFGELYFLLHWLIPALGARTAVAYWRGPFGARHDFEWVGHSVEVKTSASARGHIYRIHGVEQLECPHGGDLYLFGLVVRQECGGDHTVPLLVAELRSVLAAESAALNDVEAGLFEIGYSPAHETDYSELRIRVADMSLFSVSDDFPRLTRDKLSSEMLLGVERLTYEVNLNTFTHLIVARTPPLPSLLP